MKLENIPEKGPKDLYCLPLGQRIHIMGDTCSGKSLLAQRLGTVFHFPVIEIDALNWLPNWVALIDSNPAELEKKLNEATAGEAWIVAGSYGRLCQKVFWSRLQTVIFLDLPWRLLVLRLLGRSWRRWRKKELLWGTNYEDFWKQLRVWNKEESLLWWLTTRYKAKRRSLLHYMTSSEWQHIRFIRLTSQQEIENLMAALELEAEKR